MKLLKNSKHKIFWTIGLLIVSAVIVLFVLAGLGSAVFHVGFADAFTSTYLYVAWGILVTLGIMGIVFDYRFNGARRVLKVNADLENSRWLEHRELKFNEGFTVCKFSDLGRVNDGIPIYAQSHGNQLEICLKAPIHTLVIGATSTGKTSAFVSPTIEILSRTQTKPSLIITDPKGELYDKHATSLEKQGYHVMMINLADVYRSTRWNPFSDVIRKTKLLRLSEIKMDRGKYNVRGVKFMKYSEAQLALIEEQQLLYDEIHLDLQDLIYTMCPIISKTDTTWESGARDFILSVIIGMWEDLHDGLIGEVEFNLFNLHKTIVKYAGGELAEYKMYLHYRGEKSKAKDYANTLLTSIDRQLSSYLSEVQRYLTWLSDNGVAALTSGNELDFNSFDEKASVLFLKIPDEKEGRHKLVSLFMTQMYKALVEKATENKKHGKTKSQELLRHVYFVLDEFGNLPKLYNIDKIVTVGRSRGIFIIPIIQDFNQLVNIYGRDVAAILRSNCNIQIFIGTNDDETRRLFSEMCGKKKVKSVSFSDSKEMSVSSSAQSVPLIYPIELERLNDPANKIFGNVIVSCLGTYPIRGKFLPHFQGAEFYGNEQAPTDKRPLTIFDPKEMRYDIVDVATFLGREYAITNGLTEIGSITQEQLIDDEIENKPTENFTQTILLKYRERLSSNLYASLTGASWSEQIAILDQEIEVASSDQSRRFYVFEIIKLRELLFRLTSENRRGGRYDQ